jgi:hypothetical protein
MKKTVGFRGWYYFRIGWSTYFAFILAAINTLTVTYYLAIENIPLLQTIFPTFVSYVITIISIGIPLLVAIGYIHYKRSAAYSSETDVIAESNPYNYKLPPRGWNQTVNYPLYLLLTEMIIKSSKNEQFSDDELLEIKNLQKKIKLLIDGEFVNHPRKK